MAEMDNREKLHILIVEDDRPLADGLCRALKNERVEAVSCHTLGEAAVRLEEMAGLCVGFDLVVLDVNLPDGNGFDFLQEIKEKYDISVIMLTANDMETDIVAGLEAGADDYITKPFSLAVLRARVATQLRRETARRERETGVASEAGVGEADATNGSAGTVGTADAANGNAATVGTANSGVVGETTTSMVTGDLSKYKEEGWIEDGAYRFHFAKMLFFHGGEQVELSKTEQRLLRMLVENKHATLTREQLLDYTWSVDAAFVDENTLSVAVKRLRDKLGAQERIKTVYGIGYRWE